MDWAYPAAVVTELKGSPNGGVRVVGLREIMV